MVSITAKRTNGREISVDFDLPPDLKSLVDKYGESIIYNHAKGSLVVALQGWLRGQLDGDKKDADIKTAVANWKPGQRKQGKTQAEKLKEAMATMSPEERTALLKELRASVNAGPKAVPPAA